MNKNIQIPPRGLMGRFMRRVPVANFTYVKPDGSTSLRSVIVLPDASLGDHLKGFDLTRNDYRTFRRDAIFGGVKVQNKYLDTVTGLVR